MHLGVEAHEAGLFRFDVKLQTARAPVGFRRRLCAHRVNVNNGFVIFAEAHKMRVGGHDGFELGEDYKSIVHIHPIGAEPTAETDRGTGSLEFHIEPEQPGLMRLYAQVQIGGVSKFARFTLQVGPAQK